MSIVRARDYASLGWRVFPCHSPAASGCSCGNTDCTSVGKHPRTLRGCLDATTDPATIERWCRQWPTANIAIATGSASGVVAIDLDSDIELPAVIAAIPPTPTAKTSRGRHIYLTYPTGKKIRNRSKIRGLPIDARGEHGYVLAPPSMHHSGHQYHWLISPWDCQLAEPSAELLEWLSPPPPPPPPPPPRSIRQTDGRLLDRARRYAAKCAPAVQGCNGSARLMRTLRLLHSRFPELDADQFRSVAAEYSARCLPPWSEPEIEHAVTNILRREQHGGDL